MASSQDQQSPERTALLLIGFQNDFFHPEGALHAAVEQSVRESQVLQRSLRAIEAANEAGVRVLSLPLLYSRDYSELQAPVGLLATIRDIGAFRRGSPGAEIVPEIQALGDRVQTLQGKTGFNGFNGTELDRYLREHEVDRVTIAGIVTSVCVDSTARASAELGYVTTILSDCTAGKSSTEQEFYCEHVFPMYAEVKTSEEWLASFSGRSDANSRAA